MISCCVFSTVYVLQCIDKLRGFLCMNIVVSLDKKTISDKKNDTIKKISKLWVDKFDINLKVLNSKINCLIL